MKYIFIIWAFLLTTNLSSFDYIIESHAKREIIKSYPISDKEKFLSFKLDGTFTDNLGNYGVWDNASILTLKGNNVINLQGYGKTTYQNNEVVYNKGFRNQQEQQSGVGKVRVVNASNGLKSLLGMECTYAVNFYLDNAYFIQKCKITEERKETLSLLSR